MNVTPALPDTQVTSDGTMWTPASFKGFLHELHHIAESCQMSGSLTLFRGHRKSEWLLDSTFARSFKSTLFQLPPEHRLPKKIAESPEVHSAALNLFLLKFDVLVRPSVKLVAAEKEHGVDALFELMKRIQQYSGKPDHPNFPDHPHFIKGTNFLDWTRSSDVALYFANEKREGTGAIYVCDASATGKSQQIVSVDTILQLLRDLRDANQALGAPLLFHPSKQILNLRAKNQQAIYFAQMDLRYDLEFIWKIRETTQPGERILIKLILPSGTEAEASNYLLERGVTRNYIYPDD